LQVCAKQQSTDLGLPAPAYPRYRTTASRCHLSPSAHQAFAGHCTQQRNNQSCACQRRKGAAACTGEVLCPQGPPLAFGPLHFLLQNKPRQTDPPTTWRTPSRDTWGISSTHLCRLHKDMPNSMACLVARCCRSQAAISSPLVGGPGLFTAAPLRHTQLHMGHVQRLCSSAAQGYKHPASSPIATSRLGAHRCGTSRKLRFYISTNQLHGRSYNRCWVTNARGQDHIRADVPVTYLRALVGRECSPRHKKRLS
jgi:hypothetical protein